MDICARALLAAARMIEDGKLQAAVDERYSDWNVGLGRTILHDAASLETLSEHILAKNLEPGPRSGRQEAFENLVNRYV